MKLYLIPGQGYDERIFKNLNLSDYNVKYINWIEPKSNESFRSYSKRMASNINNNNEDIVLIGHSLGGLVALEIGTIMKIRKIILISSMKTRKEMPFLLKIVKPLKTYNLLTKKFSINTITFWGKFHDFETRKEQELFKSMISNHSNIFLQWAFKERKRIV